MGVLMDDTVRLCEQIRASRSERGAGTAARKADVRDLKGSVSAMQTGFRGARTEMARQTRAERLAFIKDLKRDVAALKEAGAEAQAAFRRAHAETVRRSAAVRERFVSSLKREVAGQQRGVRADLEGARRAWAGMPMRAQKTTVEAPRKTEKPRRTTSRRSKRR